MPMKVASLIKQKVIGNKFEVILIIFLVLLGQWVIVNSSCRHVFESNGGSEALAPRYRPDSTDKMTRTSCLFYRSIGFESTYLFLLMLSQNSELWTAPACFLLRGNKVPCILHYLMQLGKRNSWRDGIKIYNLISSHLKHDCNGEKTTSAVFKVYEIHINR